MKSKTLIATLGDHPTVLAGMVKALQNTDVEIERLVVLYPLNEDRSIGDSGFDMVKENIDGVDIIDGVPLPFEDPTSEADSVEFLRVVSNVLDIYSDPGTNDVYLSVAGGRKNMSALLALMAQFYPSVKGIYRIFSISSGRESKSPLSNEFIETGESVSF